jgi:hypothetical protein
VALHALEHLGGRGPSCFLGVIPVIREPITIAAAAARVRRPERTVRTWASRYHVRKLARLGKTAWYDWHDLKTIERCLRRGEPVPATPELRDQLRASLAAA